MECNKSLDTLHAECYLLDEVSKVFNRFKRGFFTMEDVEKILSQMKFDNYLDRMNYQCKNECVAIARNKSGVCLHVHMRKS